MTNESLCKVFQTKERFPNHESRLLVLTGNIKSDKELEEMLSQAPGQLNFTVFLAMMGDKIKG